LGKYYYICGLFAHKRNKKQKYEKFQAMEQHHGMGGFRSGDNLLPHDHGAHDKLVGL
jgi:hypothetical protein